MVEQQAIWEAPLVIDPDMDWADIEQEWDAMVDRSIMTQHFIQGNLDLITYLDFLESQGIQMDQYIQETNEAADHVLREGIEVE